MNRLPPHSSAQCSFISLPFLRTMRSSCLVLEGSPIVSPLSRTEIVPHQSDTQPPLPTTWKFQNHSAKTAIMFFRSNRGLPTHPSGAGRVQHNKKVAAKQWKWAKWEKSAPPTPLRTLLSDSHGSKRKKKDAFDSRKCGNVCTIRTALHALTFSQQGGHFSQRRSILHLLLVV